MPFVKVMNETIEVDDIEDISEIIELTSSKPFMFCFTVKMLNEKIINFYRSFETENRSAIHSEVEEIYDNLNSNLYSKT